MFTLSKKKIPPSHAFRGIKFQGNTPPPFCHIKEFRRKYSNFLYKKSLDRCTSTDIENLILEFDAQKNSDYDFESAEKRLSRVLQEERLRLFEFPSLSLFLIKNVNFPAHLNSRRRRVEKSNLLGNAAGAGGGNLTSLSGKKKCRISISWPKKAKGVKGSLILFYCQFCKRTRTKTLSPSKKKRNNVRRRRSPHPQLRSTTVFPTEETVRSTSSSGSRAR